MGKKYDHFHVLGKGSMLKWDRLVYGMSFWLGKGKIVLWDLFFLYKNSCQQVFHITIAHISTILPSVDIFILFKTKVRHFFSFVWLEERINLTLILHQLMEQVNRHHIYNSIEKETNERELRQKWFSVFPSNYFDFYSVLSPSFIYNLIYFLTSRDICWHKLTLFLFAASKFKTYTPHPFVTCLYTLKVYYKKNGYVLRRIFWCKNTWFSSVLYF